MAKHLDRYEEFRDNNSIRPMPGLTIPKKSSDKNVIYKQGESRLDKFSQTYYGTPYFGWLIMLCNQQFGGMEFDIPNNQVIRIPFPLDNAVNRYLNEIKKYKELNG